MTNFNKQQVISEVLQELEKRRLELSANVEQFKKSASESSKSTESWSDSSRSQFNMMAGAIQNDIRAVESAAILLKNSASKVAKVTGVGSLVFVEENNQEKYFFIVPESAGYWQARRSHRQPCHTCRREAGRASTAVPSRACRRWPRRSSRSRY